MSIPCVRAMRLCQVGVVSCMSAMFICHDGVPTGVYFLRVILYANLHCTN